MPRVLKAQQLLLSAAIPLILLLPSDATRSTASLHASLSPASLLSSIFGPPSIFVLESVLLSFPPSANIGTFQKQPDSLRGGRMGLGGWAIGLVLLWQLLWLVGLRFGVPPAQARRLRLSFWLDLPPGRGWPGHWHSCSSLG